METHVMLAGVIESARRKICSRAAIAYLVLAGIGYSVASDLAIARKVSEYEWSIIGLRLTLLLPPLILVLRPARGDRRPTFHLSSPRLTAAIILIFIIGTATASFRLREGFVIGDENSYRFQAQIFASGRFVADAPSGILTSTGIVTWPLKYKHEILSRSIWCSKYPIGWPLVLALAEKCNSQWIVAPALGGLLLILTGLIATEALGKQAVLPSVWMTALSPYYFANCSGCMAHALCGLLIAAECWLYLRWNRTRRARDFAGMCVLMVFGFHVRPFTAAITSLVLVTSALLSCPSQIHLLRTIVRMSIITLVVAATSFLVYNWGYTGSPWVSPYAMSRGLQFPLEISANPSFMFPNLKNLWWPAAKSTLVYTFPFAFPLATIGFFSRFDFASSRVLASLFPALMIGHLVQTEASNSPCGERYWFEGYFGVTVLASQGMLWLFSRWRSSNASVIVAMLVLTGVQLTVTAVGFHELDERSAPAREVTRVAEKYRNRRYVVFLNDGPGFSSVRLNLNTPDWKSAPAFFLRDPGPPARPIWASHFGRRSWAVVSYDHNSRTARSVNFHADATVGYSGRSATAENERKSQSR
jgi:hypothetical protein